jgi:quercetin dioxygenase-like cupin family protein
MSQTISMSDLTTLHIHGDDVPWVQIGHIEKGSVEMRVLHAPVSGEFLVTQARVGPGVVSSLHRHIGPAFAYTTLGRWGHDDTYAYRPGTYVFETPGVLHRFYSGQEPITEVTFVSYATLEFIDPDTLEVIGTETPADPVRRYFEACEEAGLPRPNVLR